MNATPYPTKGWAPLSVVERSLGNRNIPPENGTGTNG